MHIKNILFLSIIIVILSVSAVSAADTNNASVTNIANFHDASLDGVNSHHVDSSIVNADNNGKTDNNNSSSPAAVDSTKDNNITSFNELQKEIDNCKEGSVLFLNHDYKDLNASTIYLNKNISIVGNNHTIYCNGCGDSHVLEVGGNNVAVNNLNFANVSNAPISWQGNDGLLIGCTFSGSKITSETKCPDTGGAVTWEGENGIIHDCKFIDTSAMLGGALYIKGTNMTVLNSTFTNCKSSILGESIFVAPSCKKSNIKSNFTNYGDIAIIDASSSDVCDNYISVHHEIDFMNNTFDGIELLYNTLIYGSNKIDENTMYYGLYCDNCTYQLSIIKNLEDGCVYQKDLVFSSVSNSTDVFNKMKDGNYTSSQRFIKTAEVNCLKDYNNAHDLKAKTVFSKYMNLLNSKDKQKVIKSLNVKFNDNLSINSKATWSKAQGFDVIHIDGHGSKIYCNSSDRDTNKFASLVDSFTLSLANATISGFNTAFENLKGSLYLKNVTLDHNKKNYRVDRDYGAAIVNVGNTFINNCKFTNNYAKYGGAIFNQGYLSIDNSTFKNNQAYGHKGNNICNAQKGIVLIDGKDCSNGSGLVDYAKSFSVTKIKALVYASMGISALAGIGVGIVTLNPIAGLAAGAGVGAAIGAATSAIVANNIYDVSYDRAATVACIVSLDAVIGFMGSAAGGVGNAAASVSYVRGPVFLAAGVSTIPSKIWYDEIMVQLGEKSSSNEFVDATSKVNDFLQIVHELAAVF